MYLRLAIYKKVEIFSRYQTTHLLKTYFLFLVCKKGQKQDKSEFIAESVGIIVAIILM